MLSRLGLANKLFGPDPKLEFRKPTNPQGLARLTGGLSDSTPPLSRSDTAYWSQYTTLFDGPADVLTLIDARSLTRAPIENLVALVQALSEHLFSLLADPDFPHAPRTSHGHLNPEQDKNRDRAKEALNCLRVLTRVVPFLGPPHSSEYVKLWWTPEQIPRAPRTRSDLSARESESHEKQGYGQGWRGSATTTATEQSSTLDGTGAGEPPATEMSQFVIDDDDEDDQKDVAKQAGQPTEKDSIESGTDRGVDRDDPDVEELPPLAERLVAALVDLAFVPGFTVAEDCRTDDTSAISYVIWEPGIAHSPASPLPPTPPTLLSARLEVLRLLSLLIALPALQTPPHQFPVEPNQFRHILTGGRVLEQKVVLCLLCSLLNTALAAATSDTSIFSSTSSSSSASPGTAQTAANDGGMLRRATGAAEKLGGVVLRREDVRGLLAVACWQVLGALLVHHAEDDPLASISRSAAFETTSAGASRRSSVSVAATPAAAPSRNQFRFFLSKLHRASDFDLIARGVLSLLDRGLSARTSRLPLSVVSGLSGAGGPGGGGGATASAGSMTGVAEALTVLWRVMDGNRKFVSYLVETERASELLVWLVVVCLEFKDDEAQLQLVRLAAFMMQSITAERGVGSRINAPVEMRSALRQRYGVPGTVADFVIVSIYTLVFTTKARLATMYPAFVLTIDNVSPWCKGLSQVSATRLVQLFLALSAPSFLLMEEGNPRLVYYLLETFNNMIHYQLPDNPELTYALCRSYKRFEQLSTFTLAGGIAEARAERASRKKSSAAQSTPGSAPRDVTTGDRGGSSPIPGSEPASTTATTGSGVPVSTPLPGLEAEGNPREPEDDDGGDLLLSEKARGKRRQVSSDGFDGVVNGLHGPTEAGQVGDATASAATTMFVGKNGFVPTEAWVSSWRQGLPLDSILILIAELRPMILDLSSAGGGGGTTTASPNSTSSHLSTTSPSPSAAISLLKSASLAGLLPPSPPPHPRAFTFAPQSITWLASVIYGSVYLSTFELVRDVQVQLFGVANGSGSGSASESAAGLGTGRGGLGAGPAAGLGGRLGNPLEMVSGAASALFNAAAVGRR